MYTGRPNNTPWVPCAPGSPGPLHDGARVHLSPTEKLGRQTSPVQAQESRQLSPARPPADLPLPHTLPAPPCNLQAALLINVLAWLADFSESGLANDALQVFAAHRIVVALVAFAALVYADAVRLR